jgi:hypothetical protein
VITGIGKDQRLRATAIGAGIEHRQQQRMLRSGTVRRGFDDDLILGIHHRNAAIPLHDALVGRQLRRVVVGEVRLADLAACAHAIVGVRRQPIANFGRLPIHPRDPRRDLLLDPLRALFIVAAVTRQHLLRTRLQLLRTLQKLRARA